MCKQTLTIGLPIIGLVTLLSGATSAAQNTAPTATEPVAMAVIVNVNNSVTNVSVPELRRILSGEKRTWPGGTPIKILARPSGSHEQIALLRLLKMSETEYKQYWTAQVFRGEADAEPVTLPSFGMTKEATKAFAGSIALVNAQDVKPGMDIKVLKVENHLPGEPGYPIQ
jgi:ABC-type phosphate transport system substrate-binding protein